MAQQIQTYAITAPGFYGLNTQDSPTSLDLGFALTAVNCVIDSFGRIGSRKGWEPQHSIITSLGVEAPVQAIVELIENNGVSTVLFAGNNRLYKLVGTTATELTYGGGGVAPTITASNWSTATLNGHVYFFQVGHDPLVYDPSTSTTTYRRVSEHVHYNGTVQQSDIVISAYGRLWNASTANNKVLVQWSDLLEGYKYATGTSGTLDLTTVWPKNTDSITALGAHNGFLYIFGNNTILIYQGANNPSTMTLQDVVTGMGCIARDTVQNTGSDIIFLSNTGVASLQRTISEKSQPFANISKNVRNDLMTSVSGEVMRDIKAVYSARDSFYLLTLPIAAMVYCFDTRTALQDGSYRVTTWDTINPTAYCVKQNGDLLLGKPGFTAKYTGYYDDGDTYRMQYYTSHNDFGDPSGLSILKKISVIVNGAASQVISIRWAYEYTGNFYSQAVTGVANSVAFYGVGQYGVATYSNGLAQQFLVAYPTGSGKVVQTGYETDIMGAPISIQKIELQAKNGKVV